MPKGEVEGEEKKGMEGMAQTRKGRKQRKKIDLIQNKNVKRRLIQETNTKRKHR